MKGSKINVHALRLLLPLQQTLSNTLLHPPNKAYCKERIHSSGLWQNGLFEFFCQFHRFLTTRGLFFKSDFYASSTISSCVSRTDSSHKTTMDASLPNLSMTDYASSRPLNATSPLREAGVGASAAFVPWTASWWANAVRVGQAALMERAVWRLDRGLAGQRWHASVRALPGIFLASTLYPPQESCLVECLPESRHFAHICEYEREKWGGKDTSLEGKHRDLACRHRCLSDLSRSKINAVIPGQAVGRCWLEE